MDDLLLGYVLNALEGEELAQVEGLLARDPGAQARVALLQTLVGPLADDAEAFAPPAALAERTLQRIGELPLAAPPSINSRRIFGPSSRWRRADLLVAASIVLAVVGLGLPAIFYLRGQNDAIACQSNLAQMYSALKMYSDQNGQRYPVVKPPRQGPNMIPAVLRDAGAPVTSKLAVCPALPTPSPIMKPMHEVLTMEEPAFRAYAADLENTYAYSLGYRQGDRLISGWSHEEDKPNGMLPIMADCPPLDVTSGANSLSHGGKGQNVLFLDGHVKFCSSRQVGYAKDDIYLNQKYMVEPGVNWKDAVLATRAGLP